MRKAASIFALLLTLTACLTSSLGRAAPITPPAKGSWCGTSSSFQTSAAWPKVFTAVAELMQQDCNQPGCVNKHPDLGYCTSAGSIQYNWPQNAMVTEYEPCMPLVKPENGSAEPCSYHFISGDVYYEYQNQPMVHGQPPSSEKSCCKISSFPMLSPSFPFYVEQYSQACKDAGFGPRITHMYAQEMVYLATPGDPPGFYGYYPEVTQPPGAGPGTWATPYGFGGATPGAFSQISYQKFIVNPKLPNFQVPKLCENAPECTMVAPASPPKVVNISDFLQCLAPVTASGCALCHTTQSGGTFQGQLPCCPNQVWNGTSCVPAQPGEMPPLASQCIAALPAVATPGGASAVTSASGIGLISSHP